MDSKASEIRYAEWFNRIQDWAQSGLIKTEYCKIHLLRCSIQRRDSLNSCILYMEQPRFVIYMK